MDVEEYVRRNIADGADEDTLQKNLTDRILEIKNVSNPMHPLLPAR